VAGDLHDQVFRRRGDPDERIHKGITLTDRPQPFHLAFHGMHDLLLNLEQNAILKRERPFSSRHGAKRRPYCHWHNGMRAGGKQTT
jgi:hypothetical protein